MRVPEFQTEAEEAEWLYAHREELAQDIIASAREGRLGEGSVARLARMRQEQAAASETRLRSENLLDKAS